MLLLGGSTMGRAVAQLLELVGVGVPVLRLRGLTPPAACNAAAAASGGGDPPPLGGQMQVLLGGGDPPKGKTATAATFGGGVTPFCSFLKYYSVWENLPPVHGAGCSPSQPAGWLAGGPPGRL